MKRMPVCLTLILVLISICPAAFSAESLTDTINQKLSPQNHSNADRVMEKIGSLVYNADDFPGLEIKGSERTINKASAFHCYKLRNCSSYPQTWLRSGAEAVFADAIELTVIPVCDDDNPSGYISISEKEGTEDEIEVRGPRMNGNAYMAWMDHIIDRSGLEEFLNENGITSLTDIKCVLGREDQAPDFIYLETDNGEFVIPYFTAGNIEYNGELIKLEDFLNSYDRYIKSEAALLPNDLNGGSGELSGYVILGIFVFVILVVCIILFSSKHTVAL